MPIAWFYRVLASELLCHDMIHEGDDKVLQRWKEMSPTGACAGRACLGLIPGFLRPFLAGMGVL